MPMFIAALFTIAKVRNSPDAPCLMNGLRKSGIYTQLSIIQLFASKWMELKIIMLSKVSQVQKDKGQIFSLICGS
jgi:hypothetical protein